MPLELALPGRLAQARGDARRQERTDAVRRRRSPRAIAVPKLLLDKLLQFVETHGGDVRLLQRPSLLLENLHHRILDRVDPFGLHVERVPVIGLRHVDTSSAKYVTTDVTGGFHAPPNVGGTCTRTRATRPSQGHATCSRMDIHPRLRALRDLVREREHEKRREAAHARRLKEQETRQEAQRRLDAMTQRLREADEARRAQRRAWRTKPAPALPSKQRAREDHERLRKLLLQATSAALGAREWASAAEILAAYERLEDRAVLPSRRVYDHLRRMAQEGDLRSIAIECEGKRTTFYAFRERPTVARAVAPENSA